MHPRAEAKRGKRSRPSRGRMHEPACSRTCASAQRGALPPQARGRKMFRVSAPPSLLSRVPPSVSIYEVSPRDGLQNERATVPMHGKLRLIDALVAAGPRADRDDEFRQSALDSAARRCRRGRSARHGVAAARGNAERALPKPAGARAGAGGRSAWRSRYFSRRVTRTIGRTSTKALPTRLLSSRKRWARPAPPV